MERADKTAGGTRMLVQANGHREDMIPRRVPADSVFASGDMVRISIESPRDGYLYVFDRELHKDGSFGDPYQIFPTTTIRSGDNRVSAGRVVDIPDQTDASPVFQLSSQGSNNDWTGELLTIIVSPTPIKQLPALNSAAPIGGDLFAALEDAYARDVAEYDQDGGAGTSWTPVEKSAGAGTRQLTLVDPYPQTIFRVKTSPGQPMMTSLSLRVGAH
jgi:hypothetical protein